jgi:hypothetical protein
VDRGTGGPRAAGRGSTQPTSLLHLFPPHPVLPTRPSRPSSLPRSRSIGRACALANNTQRPQPQQPDAYTFDC